MYNVWINFFEHSSCEFNIIEQNLFSYMYQETSQIHLNLSSIKRTKEIKSNGHLSAISPSKG